VIRGVPWNIGTSKREVQIAILRTQRVKVLKHQFVSLKGRMHL
jgi:hypothetical protein